jgi:hypothetical protein
MIRPLSLSDRFSAHSSNVYARVAAGALGFLIFNQVFDGPDLYGALSFFETMPSSPNRRPLRKHVLFS